MLPSVLALALPAAAGAPVEIVFVLDNSGSMRANDPAFLTREAVLDFSDALAKHAREQAFDAYVALVFFDEEVDLALPLTQLPPLALELAESDVSPRALLAPALASLDYSGQRTRSADGIERAL